MTNGRAPDGFVVSRKSSPFLDVIGPLYARGEGRDLQLGMPIDTRHLNSRGGLHGAIVAALADLTLGRALASSAEPRLPLVTVSLKVDYVAGATAGDWIEGHVTHLENRGLLHFGTGVILSGDRTVALMTGIFRAPQSSGLVAHESGQERET